MSKYTNTEIAVALRQLDPGAVESLTEAERQRAASTFERIVSTARENDHAAFKRSRARRSHWRRLAPPIALVGAAGVAVPAVLFGSGSAFASWTPTPERLVDAERAAAVKVCTNDLGISMNNSPAATIAERRGQWAYVYIVGAGVEASCLMHDDAIGEDAAADGEVLSSREESAPDGPRQDPTQLTETGSTSASTDRKLVGQDWLTWTYGVVGAEVQRVTVNTPLGFDVEASIDNGRFAAWWPSEKPSSSNPDVMGDWTYTVELVDGTTRTIVG